MKVKLFTVVIVVLIVAIAPTLSPYDPMAINLENQALPPHWQHIMGTDMLGRDVLSRLLYGGRVSLFGAFIATIIVFVLGTTAGIAAGYLGGKYNAVAQFLIDTLLILPNLVIALLVLTFLGRGVVSAIVAVVAALLANFLQVARVTALTVSSQEYITVAKSLGATHYEILKRHVLPNSFPILLSYSGVIFAYGLLGFTSLGFLGLGIELGEPEWGTMIADGFKYYRDAIWISAFPALAISCCIILINSIIDDFNQRI